MNNTSHFLLLSLYIWIYSSYCYTDVPSQAPVFSCHRHIIINKTGNWKEVDLVYGKILYRNLRNGSKAITECIRAYNTVGKSLFKCKEHIKLLRPASVINHWLTEQLQAGYINLTIKEFGLINARAYISAVKPALISQKCQLQLFSNSNRATPNLNKADHATGSSCVIGTFKRHVNNAKNYTFKNLFTGRTETIHATPNHLFYVKNKHRFIALNKIAPTDELLTLSGYKMRLLCQKGKKTHCGMRWKKNNISIVYNLEVYKEHEYFAGNNEIYVHNTYFCLVCKEKFMHSELLEKHIMNTHQKDDSMAANYNCLTPPGSQKQLEYNQTWRSAIASINKTHPFQCNYCLNAFFSRKGDLARHINNKHLPILSTHILPLSMPSHSLASAAVSGLEWPLSATQDWDRIQAEAEFQIAIDYIAHIAPTKWVDLPDKYDILLRTMGYDLAGEIYTKLLGNQLMTQMEREVAEVYYIQETPLSMLSNLPVQMVEQYLHEVDHGLHS